MSYASQSGRASTNPNSPRAFAVCDRCSRWANHCQLTWQYDWRGASLANIRILVCNQCLDVPQTQLRAIVVPADPVPIDQPRVEPFIYDSSGNSPVYGQPVGLIQNAVMPYDGATQHAYGTPISLLSLTGNGTTTVSATCSVAHGLTTNDQIAVEGLTSALATGFYSVVVTSAMAFNYVTANAVPAGSLLTPHTLMVTALVGLPYSQTTIPQV